MQEAVRKLGRYQLGDQIGAGGMAEVFRGDMSGAEGFSRPVAIKRVRQQLIGDKDAARGFIDEARLAQRLQHGNIVQTYDLGIEGGVPYIVMEFVDGLSLSDVIRHNHQWKHRLGVADALHIIEKVAAALDYAHGLSDADGNSEGVVHRDVNPRNILLSLDGIVKLTDFGIARAMNVRPRTLPGRVKGTLGYLSPEQAYGGIIGPSTDQFATGVVLYELLAGRNPLAGAAKIKDYRTMLDEGLPALEAPDVDDELRAILARATASNPTKRFKSMSEFRQVLEAWRVARGIRTSLDGVREIVRAYRGKKPPRRVTSSRLNNALLAELGTDTDNPEDTRALLERAAEPERRSRRGGVAVVLAVLLLASVVAAVLALRAGGEEATASATPVLDAAPIERADAGDEPDELVVLAVDAAPPSPREAPSEAPSELDAAIADPSPPPTLAESRRGVRLATDRAKARAAEARASARAAREAAARAVRDLRARERASDEEKARPAKKATLRINVLPYAEISVDGKRRGRTPRTLSVPAGIHKVRLHNPGTGKTTTRSITVGAGETRSITSW